jgi:hypothetical protein
MTKSPARSRLASVARLALLLPLAAAPAFAQTQPAEPAKPAAETPAKPADAKPEEKPAGYAAEPESAPEQAEAAVTGEVRMSREGLGLDPGALTFGGLVLPPPPGSQFDSQDLKSNQLNYHGFLRAPLRIGIGSGDFVEPGVATGAKLHSPPIIVDGSYTNWTYTGDNGGPWTELRLSWGNAKVFGNVSIASYNLTDAGFKDLVAQLGIDQAWVTINMPDFFGDRGGFLVNVGAFGGGYGSAGRYDAGAYGTYVFGRTHGTGYTISTFYDITDEITLQAEQGIGARLDVTPFDPAAPSAPWLPYAGPVEQFPTMLHHAHVGATYMDHFRLAFHYLTGWTQAATRAGEKDGRISSYGAEFKMIDTQFGHAFLGIGRLTAKEALRVAGVLEAIHSWEGWSLAENYFGAASQGNGNITTVAWEWTFSLATFLRYPESFWGQGPDFVFRTFGMFNSVEGTDNTFAGATSKLKLGGSLTYTPLSWMGVSFRYDLVQPNMSDSRESFQVFSPRILLRTDFITNEEIVLQYNRYQLGANVKPNYPYDERMMTNPAIRPDENVVSLIATMWW